MPYLIDSDWLIDLLLGLPEAQALYERLAADGISASIISYIETYEGVDATADPADAERRLEVLLTSIPLAALSEEVARRCARLRLSLRREGKRVNTRAMDLIIAATALEHGLTLVTRNRDDYKDIPGLRLYA